MATYTPVNDFSAKDDLDTGDPEKVISGADMDAETAAIQTAVNAKQDDLITTRGDVIRGSSAAAAERLAVGTAGQFLGTDGTDALWVTPDWILVASTSASSDKPVITSGLASTYAGFVIVLTDIIPVDDASHLYLRTSTDGGSTYDSTSGHYEHCTVSRVSANNTVSASASGVGGPTTAIKLTREAMGTASNETLNARILMYDPTATGYTFFSWELVHLRSAGDLAWASGGGVRKSAADVDAFQLSTDGASGNITSGQIRVYGFRDT